MDRPGTQMWTWTLCVLLSLICVGQAAEGPKYMVTIPAILEAGAETQVCTSLLRPTEALTVTATIVLPEENVTIATETSSMEFHTCKAFTVPSVKHEVANLRVEVKGDTYYSEEVRKILIRTLEPMTFIQTDRPIYTPGQTVNFRVVTIDTKFRPADRLYDDVYVEDPHHNKIGHWINQTSNGKILQLSYSLNSEASEGSYSVIVLIGEEKIQANFNVEKYVLPKLGVKINAADEVNIEQEEITVEVCAKYTYGKSVPADVTAQLCRPLRLYIGRDENFTAPCALETKTADISGCATFDFKMSIFNTYSSVVLQNSLQLKVLVKEASTGITHEEEKEMSISYAIGKLSFIDTPKFYLAGTEVTGAIKAVSYNNEPIPDLLVSLFEGERWAGSLIETVKTNSDGIANFTYNTDSSKGDILFYASKTEPGSTVRPLENRYYGAAFIQIPRARDPLAGGKTVSSLEVQTKEEALHCETEEQMTIKFTIVGEEQGTSDLLYLVLARGAIVTQGVTQIQLLEGPVTEGEVSFPLTVSPDMAPLVQIVAYTVLPSETVIAHRADFATDKCFSKKVELEFDPSSGVPGEEITLQVRASPDSLCCVSAVDKSLFILEPGKFLNEDTIFDLLPVPKITYIPPDLDDHYPCLDVRPKRHILPHDDNTDDAFTVFTDAGLKMATNLLVRAPTCLNYGGRKYVHTSDAVVASGRAPHGPTITKETRETIRTFFPETWIWDLVEVGDSGTQSVSVKVPDSITTWETEAFCLNAGGFGLAPRKDFIAFQPFFLDINLPQSAVRGESFELKATVFSYRDDCIRVTVTPVASMDYVLTKVPYAEYTTCLCASEQKTFSWTMEPRTIGDVSVSVTAEAVTSHITCNNEIVKVPEKGAIDTVTKTLKVNAEGVKKTATVTWLFCPTETTLSEEVEIQLPENLIGGSGRALVSVLGDVVGRSLHNLDSLLEMPYGCGEQNMARMASDIYILQYLAETNQLTPENREKAEGYLVSGYQRQLDYRNHDGSFSTFGTGAANTWLTAFVMRTLAKANNVIYIDPDVINDAKVWLEKQQLGSGCYEQTGSLYNNAMLGGVSDEVTLSGYVAAAFLEVDPTPSESVKRSISCLNETLDDLSNTYYTALLAYIFTLAGEMEIRANLLTHLDNVAIKEGGSIHWTQTATDSSASLSVEISSYVLMAIMSAETTAESLGYASRIVKWLSSQQNFHGGFSSTQDTVAALQAMALYSTRVYSPEGASKVTISSPNVNLEFDVTPENKLLYQEQGLRDVTGKYKVEVTGNACASVQISQHYNIPYPVKQTSLSLNVGTVAECGSTSHRPTMTLNMKCSFSGNESSTNMAILDIKMLSGFRPVPESLKKLKDVVDVERVEEQDDHVLVYIQKISKDVFANFKLRLVQELPVSDMKEAVVKIYDYYQPGDMDRKQYIYPCTALEAGN